MANPGFIMENGTTLLLDFIQYGSDQFNESLRRSRKGVIITRYNTPIALRTWKNTREWNLNLNGVPKSTIESLQEFYEEGVFWLRTNIYSAPSAIKVMWDGDFTPVRIAPDIYSLQGTLKEMV